MRIHFAYKQASNANSMYFFSVTSEGFTKEKMKIQHIGHNINQWYNWMIFPMKVCLLPYLKVKWPSSHFNRRGFLTIFGVYVKWPNGPLHSTRSPTLQVWTYCDMQPSGYCYKYKILSNINRYVRIPLQVYRDSKFKSLCYCFEPDASLVTLHCSSSFRHLKALGECLYTNSHHTVIAAWLNTSKRSWDGVWLNRSARE